MVAVDDLKSAKDAGLACVKAIRGIQNFGHTSFGIGPCTQPHGATGVLSYPRPAEQAGSGGVCLSFLARRMPTFGAFAANMRECGKSAFAECSFAAERARRIYTPEVRETLLLANGGDLFHDKAIRAAERAHGLLFDPAFPQAQREFTSQVRATSETPVLEHLRRFLREMSGPAAPDYWIAVMARARAWDFDCDKAVVGIENEYSAAVRDLGPEVEDEPLTEDQGRVAEFIRNAEGPVMGRKIVNHLGMGSESSLTSHIIPALKKKLGLKNRPGAGYYFPRGN